MAIKSSLLIAACLFIFSFSAKNEAGDLVIDKTVFEKDLFESDEILSIKLTGNIRELVNDRGDKPKYHPIKLSYRGKDSNEINLPVQMKTRGHFRKLRENCRYPPLQISFPSDVGRLSTVFSGQTKLKLVMPCVDDDYIIREWLAYKIYNLITPKSFKARLVRIDLNDNKNKKQQSFYGILIEDVKQLAARNKAIVVEQKLTPQETQRETFLTMAVFQYLIGNTDWSVEYLQNIKLLKTGSSSQVMTVPYDFDHSGIVNAPYAHPPEALLLKSVMERRYRGYCVTDLKIFETTIALYNKVKKDIYDLYTSCAYLDARSLKEILKFLDGFYATINNPKSWQKEFAYPCDKNGTGHIVIRGLKED